MIGEPLSAKQALDLRAWVSQHRRNAWVPNDFQRGYNLALDHLLKQVARMTKEKTP